MIAPIEGRGIERYWPRMRSLALRLLAILAVMAMPLGMATAPAATPHHQQMAAAMPMEHCPGPESGTRSTGALAHCTMACAAALPATDLAPAVSHPVLRCSPATPSIKFLSGIEPEIATPPPRLA